MWLMQNMYAGVLSVHLAMSYWWLGGLAICVDVLLQVKEVKIQLSNKACLVLTYVVPGTLLAPSPVWL